MSEEQINEINDEEECVSSNSRHISFPSIEQFKATCKHVGDKVTFDGYDENGDIKRNRLALMPKLKFIGTTKIHGSNSAIVFRPNEDISFQSRSRILSLEQDNAGFMMFCLGIGNDNLKKLIPETYSNYKELAIFGEWAGGNIQKGVAVTQLPKMFVVFAVKINDGEKSRWLKKDEVAYFKAPDHRIFNIYDFQTWEVEIDFNDPKSSIPLLCDITQKVEEECPVGKGFGVSGIGEGVVWHCEENGFTDSRFWFKVKGEKHSVSKVKKLVTIDIEKHESIKAFVDSVVTENRLQQGVQSIIEQNAINPETVYESKNIGPFLKWINQDILKEEKEGIANCGASDFKEIAPFISKKAREWFINKIG